VTGRATPTSDTADPLPSWSALVNVYQSVLHDVVAALDQQTGIDSGVFSALAYLERAGPPHRLPMGELQRSMYPRYSQPGFSRLVQRMEADGFVERRVDRTDRRATIIATTRAGRRQFRRANSIYIATLRTSFGRHLRTSEHARLAAMLGRVTTRRGARTRVPTESHRKADTR
jgi:DNA-binding MarR family transcriptional regulator